MMHSENQPHPELLEIKRKLDPDGLFTSDLARRVGIDPVLNKLWPE